jgi:hypothetical protein
MNNNSIIFIGLDIHKEFNEVAYCEDEKWPSKTEH